MTNAENIGAPAARAVQKRASGSSFYVAMRLMPAEERDAMFAIYAFCRKVDDIANDGIGTLVHTNEYQAIRKAQKKDARGIHHLIKASVENEELLPRTLSEIERGIGNYFVFEVDGNLAGCIALHFHLEDKKAEDPTHRLQNRDLMRLVTRGLNRNERLIIILYYYEDMTMKEIGATLDLSESRVSQMHSSIVSRLQAQLAKRKPEFST